jgi:hypothetical protein
MNFPISRERLQNIAKEFEEAQIQKYINSIVDYIKELIIIKAYTDSPKQNPQLGSPNCGNHVNGKQNMYNMLKLDLPLPYQQRNRISGSLFENDAYLPPYNDWKKYLSTIIERLQAIFPGVTFQVDPLKTYLLVDWS